MLGFLQKDNTIYAAGQGLKNALFWAYDGHLGPKFGLTVPGLTRLDRYRNFWMWFGAQTTTVVRWRASCGQHPGPRANVSHKVGGLWPQVRFKARVRADQGADPFGRQPYDRKGLRPDPLSEITTAIRPGEARC